MNTINSDTDISVVSRTLGNGGRFIGIAPLNGDSPILYSASLALEKISGISPNSAVTVYGKNILPCTAPLSIQNDTFTNRNHVFLSSLKIGRAVDRNRSYGSVVFSSGADFTFNVSGNVGLYNGLEIHSGAAINIISDGVATLDSIIIDSKSSLSVNCDTCKLSNLTIPKGASLIIQ